MPRMLWQGPIWSGILQWREVGGGAWVSEGGASRIGYPAWEGCVRRVKDVTGISNLSS